MTEYYILCVHLIFFIFMYFSLCLSVYTYTHGYNISIYYIIHIVYYV